MQCLISGGQATAFTDEAPETSGAFVTLRRKVKVYFLVLYKFTSGDIRNDRKNHFIKRRAS